jgi:hypothetical protein
MTNFASVAPRGNHPTVGKTASSSASAGGHPVVDKTNPFVGLDVSGFGPKEGTVAKEMSQVGAVQNLAPQPPTVRENRKPLGPGESLWSGRVEQTRFNNIVGGWVKRTG